MYCERHSGPCMRFFRADDERFWRVKNTLCKPIHAHTSDDMRGEAVHKKRISKIARQRDSVGAVDSVDSVVARHATCVTRTNVSGAERSEKLKFKFHSSLCRSHRCLCFSLFRHPDRFVAFLLACHSLSCWLCKTAAAFYRIHPLVLSHSPARSLPSLLASFLPSVWSPLLLNAVRLGC